MRKSNGNRASCNRMIVLVKNPDRKYLVRCAFWKHKTSQHCEDNSYYRPGKFISYTGLNAFETGIRIHDAKYERAGSYPKQNEHQVKHPVVHLFIARLL